MVNAGRKAGLGNTLQKAQKLANQRRNPRKSDRHTVETNPSQDNARLDLKSVTAQTNLDEFFEEAELAGKQFITERRNLALINKDETHVDLYDKNERIIDELKLKVEDIDLESSLSVPRRPKWDASTTSEELAEREKLSFLVWRKKLAKLQEDDSVILTPFEKNLEIWRQLWRVIERSDIVVQILDCRNPLLYLSHDLIKYVDEEFKGKKINLILLNKADYLTKEQRQMWATYFNNLKIRFIFFSALYESDDLKNFRKKTTESENRCPKKSCPTEEIDDDVVDRLQDNLNLNGPEVYETRIYDKFELLDAWHHMLMELGTFREGQSVDASPKQTPNAIRDDSSETSSSHNHPLTVGLVGYPNVGKSSTINALLSAKRVAVSSTPGKTKHFQTFLIDRDMMLCDCPGLVFPNFVSCKSEMVINGVLPIDQMKDYVGPVRIIVDRIPRGYFEEIYGLAFEQDAKQNIVADDLLNAFGFMRGYMTARGLPDISRAARRICKDYINGKILYCEPPPNVDKKLYHSYSKIAETMKRILERGNNPDGALRITERQQRLMKQAKGAGISSKEFDEQFFQTRISGVHIKGLPGIGNMTQPVGKLSEMKVSKRERKHKKKEKLRRVYRDLDV